MNEPDSRLARWLLGLAVVVPAWALIYGHLTEFADAMISLAGLTRETRLGEAVHFFFYDTPKVLLLLTAVVFVMGIIHTFVSPERTRAVLSGRRLGFAPASPPPSSASGASSS